MTAATIPIAATLPIPTGPKSKSCIRRSADVWLRSAGRAAWTVTTCERKSPGAATTNGRTMAAPAPSPPTAVQAMSRHEPRSRKTPPMTAT